MKADHIQDIIKFLEILQKIKNNIGENCTGKNNQDLGIPYN